MARWAPLLDRVELRRAGLGLKFWGPPLWLEVTMTGPDSDRWPAPTERNESWNWQSDHTCVEAEHLFDQGADDDHVVMAVGRYTVENLVLNAVHEIGEWLRFDGLRIFTPHPAARSSPAHDPQGNGRVQLTATFRSSALTPPVVPPSPWSVVQVDAQHLLGRLAALAAASRFTYLPGTAVRYQAAGPVIQFHTAGQPTKEWSSRWSTATLEAVRDGRDAETLIGLVQRDVHGALVAWEADQTCRAFYVDHRRPWSFSVAEPTIGPELDPHREEASEILTLTIGYLHPDRVEV